MACSQWLGSGPAAQHFVSVALHAANAALLFLALAALTRTLNLRQGEHAVRLAERAGQLTRHQEPFMLGTLAAAYAETGRQEEAIQTASRAIDLAEAKGLTQVAQRNRELREIYRSGQPWREPVTP